MTNNIAHFHSKVAGVSHANRDGSSRQEIIETLRLGQSLELEHEDDNSVDPNAVAVKTADGQQVGYLRAEVAQEVMQEVKHGRQYTAVVSDLTGGSKEHKIRGVNIALFDYGDDTTPEDLQNYIQEHFTEIIDTPGAELKRVTTGTAGEERRNGTLLWVIVALVLVALLIIFFA